MVRATTIAASLVSLVFSNGYTEIHLWPLHGERLISSTFSEYREGHYHAGIDLRTFGRIGLPCLAINDGFVHRVRVAPDGYGKALYMQLDDGSLAVYAHLDGFHYRLDSLVYYYRLARKTSWCDITLPDNELRFAVGDTVCFTGMSGTSAPHLHFEMRDDEGRPFNPLTELYSVPDSRPPIVSALEVIPMSPESVVNGSPRPSIFLFRASKGNTYVCDDTLQLDGRFSFGLSVWDEQGFGRYFLAPFSVELFVDDSNVFRLQNHVFSYAQAREILLEYDTLDESAPGRYMLLYRKTGASRMDRSGSGFIHSDEGSSGGLYLARGVHRGRIVVRDAVNNAAHAEFTFVLHDYPVIETARRLVSTGEVIVHAFDPDGGPVTEQMFESADGGERWEAVPLVARGKFRTGETALGSSGMYHYVVRDDEGAVSERYFAAPQPVETEDNVFCECIPSITSDGLLVHVVTDRALEERPRIMAGRGTSFDTCLVHPFGPRTFSVRCDPDILADGVNLFFVEGRDYRGYPLKGRAAFMLFHLRSGAQHRFTLSDSIHVRLEAPAVRGAALCLIREVPMPGRQTEELRPVSQPFSLEFPVDRLARPLLISGEPGKGVGLFRYDEERGWKCMGIPARQGGSCTVGEPGTYAFLADGLPPHLIHVASDNQPVGSGFFRPTRYYVPVEEEGSGVDPYSATATLNEREVICEWDEFRERLLIPIPAFFPAGMSRLHVELSDRSGNRSAGDFSFVIE